MKNKKKLFLTFFWIIFAVVLVISRFFNLETSARFIWDESSDLVKMRDLFQHPKLTLIGPISEDGVKVFGSLTYYLSLPFVVLFKFDPISPVYATAFFGLITVILFLMTARKIKLPLIITGMLLLVSYPLLEAARWAWNPHFIPFWQILGVVSYLFGGIGVWFAGIFLGLTVHHHYYGIFALIGVGVVVLLNKKIKGSLIYLLGVIFALIPFVIFDLTHPPGLFLSRMLFFSPLSTSKGGFNLVSILNNLINLPLQFTSYLSGENRLIGIIILILSAINIYLTIKNKNYKWLIPVIFQLLGLSIIGGGIFNHYLLPGVIFYYLWILDNFNKNLVSKIIVLVLIISNIFSINKIIYKNDWSTNIKATREIVKIMSDEYKSNNKPFNIAVLKSPDQNTKGRRYRDLLNIENIPTAPIDDYSKVDRVFFISYDQWNNLKNDTSYELNSFRQKEPSKSWTISNSLWKVYLLKN